MTLILTEVSAAGIAMAADSAISYFNPNGTISRVDHKGWRKVLWVPRIRAGVSYWGFIGQVTRQRFDEWLEERIRRLQYQDLLGLAQFLADELNTKCGNQPLGPNQCVGIHVAGYHPWADGVRRPTFYHVHNGHGHIQWAGGVPVPALDLQGQPSARLLPTNHSWVWDPRKLFAVHYDYPGAPATHAAKLAPFNARGYLTRNGDIGHYILIGEALRNVCTSVNAVPGLRIPSDPTRIGPRLGFLKMEIETAAAFYKCSTMSRVIGGKVLTLGIRPDETRL
ncbi:MAG TPA: hypothetical protein VHD32_10695 [Candidatus Didemnitutus sp.]|nr:hypothetical protein [Candidatus Didemnitutus sp.]